MMLFDILLHDSEHFNERISAMFFLQIMFFFSKYIKLHLGG